VTAFRSHLTEKEGSIPKL